MRIFDRKWILFVVAAIFYFTISALPLNGFSHEAHMALAVFSVAAVLWVTNALPIAVVGIVVLFLLPLSGAVTAKAAYAYFGNASVFFVLGAFILVSPVMRSGLSTRMSLALISKFGRGPKSLLFSIFALSTMLTFIISEHAVAVILFPIVTDMVKAAKCKLHDKFAFTAYIAMGWGTVIGSTMTLLGGARAPLTLGILQSVTNMTISFAHWTYYVFPAVLAMLVLAFLTLLIAARGCSVDIQKAHAELVEHHAKLGKLSKREILTIVVLSITILLWVVIGSSIGLEVVAFFGVILAFALKITNWEEVEQDVQWGIFIMYGSAIALGAAMRDTGSAHALVTQFLNLGFTSPALILLIMMVLAAVLTELMSNAAAVAVLLPIGLILGQQFQIDPRAMALAIATTAGMTFLLPVSTPAIALIANSPYVKQHHVMAWGLIPKVVGFFVLAGAFFLYWPAIGLHI